MSLINFQTIYIRAEYRPLKPPRYIAVREMHIAMRIEYIVQAGKSIFNFVSKPKFVALEWESILQHL